MNKDDIRAGQLWGETPLVEDWEIFGDLAERRGTSLFLGRFTIAEILSVLEKKGFFKEARKLGLWPLVFDLDSSAYPLQRFRIFYERTDPASVIIDLKVRERPFDPAGRPGFPPGAVRTLALEWLTLQNPRADFGGMRGGLPGQQHPGLGMSRRIMDVFVFLGKRARADGLMAFPAYYHNAVLFSRYFRFLNPDKEGEITAIRRTFARMSIRQLAWIVHLGCLRSGDGTVYEWRSEEQFLPLRRELRGYFESRAYRERVREAARLAVFQVDWEAFEARMQSD
ncbi:MAG: hypothetical protein PHI34_08140 [Acidobacteriota bacterium]|nr:hypothetical protein [Acidobacteriota bacterium]